MGTYREFNRRARDEARVALVPTDEGSAAHGDFPSPFLPPPDQIDKINAVRAATRWAILVSCSAALIVALLIAVCSVVLAGPTNPIIIGHSYADHHGGEVDAFAQKYAAMRASGRRVVIDGACVSACTIVASLPRSQVCITARAMLGVHLAADSNDHVDRAYTAWAVKQYYPPALRAWIARHGGLAEAPKWLGYRDLLAIFPPCGRRMTEGGRQRTDGRMR